MTRTLYIAALEPDTGSVVAPGVMELLVGRAGGVGVLSPASSAIGRPPIRSCS